LQLTPDIQVVRAAQKNEIRTAQNILGLPVIAERKRIGTATILDSG
jgi:hypothetical protein